MPCARNGRLHSSALEPIPGGELAREAARAWNAPHGPADAGCLPAGSRSSYRTLAEQWIAWNDYLNGGALAAYPGTSEHGCGKAMDLLAVWMRAWIDEHGARFGWKKVEAFSEWWHVNYVGGVGPFPAPFVPLHLGSKGPRVKRYTRRLAYIHRTRKHGGDAYLRRWYWRFKKPVKHAVINFQRDHGLHADGIIGPKTASVITAVFRQQWEHRK